MQRSVALAALSLVALALVAPASADDAAILRYTAVEGDCRLTIDVDPDQTLDPGSPREMRIVVVSLAPKPGESDLLDANCGSFNGGVYCAPVVGEPAHGLSCDDGMVRVAIGGLEGAPELAPGTFHVPLDYEGWILTATAVRAG